MSGSNSVSCLMSGLHTDGKFRISSHHISWFSSVHCGRRWKSTLKHATAIFFCILYKWSFTGILHFEVKRMSLINPIGLMFGFEELKATHVVTEVGVAVRLQAPGFSLPGNFILQIRMVGTSHSSYIGDSSCESLLGYTHFPRCCVTFSNSSFRPGQTECICQSPSKTRVSHSTLRCLISSVWWTRC
jgi:hypothetical protein